MTIEERAQGTTVILDMTGRLVVDDGDKQIKERVATLLADGHRQIVMNVAAVSYVDSAGLGALVSSSLAARKVGGTVKLMNPSKKLVELLKMARLLSVFEVMEADVSAETPAT